MTKLLTALVVVLGVGAAPVFAASHSTGAPAKMDEKKDGKMTKGDKKKADKKTEKKMDEKKS